MREVTKIEFKEIYSRLGGGQTAGWGNDAWNRQFEEDGPPMRYLIEDPATPKHTQMMVVTDFAANEHRLFFTTQEDEEKFFDHSGKS